MNTPIVWALVDSIPNRKDSLRLGKTLFKYKKEQLWEGSRILFVIFLWFLLFCCVSSYHLPALEISLYAKQSEYNSAIVVTSLSINLGKALDYISKDFRKYRFWCWTKEKFIPVALLLVSILLAHY